MSKNSRAALVVIGGLCLLYGFIGMLMLMMW